MPFLHSYSEHYSGKCLYSYTNIFQYDIRQQQQACLLFLRHQICSKMAVMKSSCVLILLLLVLVAEVKPAGNLRENQLCNDDSDCVNYCSEQPKVTPGLKGYFGFCTYRKGGAASVVCNTSVAVVFIVSVLFQLQLQYLQTE